MADSAIGFTEDGYAQYKRIAREVTRRMQNERPQRGRWQNVTTQETAVILDADLAAASHALTGATSCLATVCEWSAVDEEYTETDVQITVWNHAEATSHVTDTFGVARIINGHWHFFGDCEPMASR